MGIKVKKRGLESWDKVAEKIIEEYRKNNDEEAANSLEKLRTQFSEAKDAKDKAKTEVKAEKKRSRNDGM